MSYLKKKVIAIIPCRSGSKKIRDKNLIKIYNKSLIQYSFIFARQCGLFDKILISTDSKKYKKIAEGFGAEIPFLRPKSISRDNSTDLEFVQHCLKSLIKKENYNPDFIVHLRPTSPLRKIKDIKKGLKILIQNTKIDSVKSISLNTHPVYKIWNKNKNNIIKPIVKNDSKFSEPHNAPRQYLPKSYIQTALFDIYRVKSISKSFLSGKKIYGLITDKMLDIDSKEDFNDIKNHKKKFKNFVKFIKKK